jgi:hypothetical protein
MASTLRAVPRHAPQETMDLVELLTRANAANRTTKQRIWRTCEDPLHRRRSPPLPGSAAQRQRRIENTMITKRITFDYSYQNHPALAPYPPRLAYNAAIVRSGKFDVGAYLGVQLPIFSSFPNEPSPYLVSNHLAIHLRRYFGPPSFLVKVCEPSECPDEPAVHQFAEGDRAHYIALLEKYGSLGPTRPTTTKHGHFATGQHCLDCLHPHASVGKKSLRCALTSGQGYKGVLAKGNGGFVKCEHCGIHIWLTAEEYARFYAKAPEPRLATLDILRPIVETDGNKKYCPTCLQRGRSRLLFQRICGGNVIAVGCLICSPFRDAVTT